MAPACHGTHRETEAQNLIESGKVKHGPRNVASSLTQQKRGMAKRVPVTSGCRTDQGVVLKEGSKDNTNIIIAGEPDPLREVAGLSTSRHACVCVYVRV